MKQTRMKVEGSGRKVGTPNAMTNELRNLLLLHMTNEIMAIQDRMDELPLLDRYKVASMLFKLLLPIQINSEASTQPIIHVHPDL